MEQVITGTVGVVIVTVLTQVYKFLAARKGVEVSRKMVTVAVIAASSIVALVIVGPANIPDLPDLSGDFPAILEELSRFVSEVSIGVAALVGGAVAAYEFFMKNVLGKIGLK